MARLTTAARKLRDVQVREQHLLDLAYGLICEQGLVALQMSHLAQAGEVAMGTLYSHFSSKEDLLLALAVRSGEFRRAQFARAVAWRECSRLRMLAVAMADWMFMTEHPHYAQIDQYALTEVVWERSSLARREDFVRSREPIGDMVAAIVRQGRADGDLPLSAMSAEEVPFGMWTMLIGTHQLAHAAGLLEHFAINQPYQLMVRHVNIWMNGWNWQPLLSADDTAGLERLCTRLQTEVFPREAA